VIKQNEFTKEHWEKVYLTKQPNEVSWTQVEEPEKEFPLIADFLKK
jgi:hypothetical protein